MTSIMKKFLPVLNIVIALAVVVLFVLFFTQKKGVSHKDNVLADSSGIELSADGLSIAWVDMDTILKSYDMYFDYLAELESTSKRLEAELSAKSKKFEKEAMEFQDKVQKGLVTRSQAQELQNTLAGKEQELYRLRDEMSAKIGEEQQVKLRQIHNSIAEYIKEYNIDKGYHIVFSYSFGGQLLYGHPALNITKDVLQGLNAKYAASIKKK